MKVIVTGSNGFVGQSLTAYLQGKNLQVEGVERGHRETEFPIHVVSDFAQFQAWNAILQGTDAVVHLAARAHKMGEEKSAATDQLYMEANRYATVALAKAAELAGVKHFIFISSIAAAPFNPNLQQDAEAQARWGTYGLSKWLAEKDLLGLQSPMRISIIRPPLIYGPGVKGNMRTLIKLARQPFPLPLGDLNDKKSFLFVDNLSDAISELIHQQPVANHVYSFKDCDLGLADIITEIRAALGRKPGLIKFPKMFIKCLLTMMGKKDYIPKIFGEQVVFEDEFSRIVKWQPPFSYKKGFQKMVNSCILRANI